MEQESKTSTDTQDDPTNIEDDLSSSSDDFVNIEPKVVDSSDEFTFVDKEKQASIPKKPNTFSLIKKAIEKAIVNRIKHELLGLKIQIAGYASQLIANASQIDSSNAESVRSGLSGLEWLSNPTSIFPRWCPCRKRLGQFVENKIPSSVQKLAGDITKQHGQAAVYRCRERAAKSTLGDSWTVLTDPRRNPKL